MRCLLLLLFPLALHAAPVFTFETATNEVRVLADGALVSAYVFAGVPKPIVYPLTAPDGVRLNREYPMQKVAGETSDHPHHQSMWFGHVDVNGVDFWSVKPGAGRQVADGVPAVQVVSNVVILLASNRWQSAAGVDLARDVRVLRFGILPGGERFIDVSVTVSGTVGDLVFKDEKDGCMGIRLRDDFNFKKPDSTARNSAGDNKATIWGKRAKWVQYEAVVSGGWHGVLAFDHPANPGFPTRWHARDYGLLSANPYGEKVFDPKSEKAGGYTISAGQSATWRYRFVFYSGRKDSAQASVLGATF